MKICHSSSTLIGETNVRRYPTQPGKSFQAHKHHRDIHSTVSQCRPLGAVNGALTNLTDDQNFYKRGIFLGKHHEKVWPFYFSSQEPKMAHWLQGSTKREAGRTSALSLRLSKRGSSGSCEKRRSQMQRWRCLSRTRKSSQLRLTIQLRPCVAVREGCSSKAKQIGLVACLCLVSVSHWQSAG